MQIPWKVENHQERLASRTDMLQDGLIWKNPILSLVTLLVSSHER